MSDLNVTSFTGRVGNEPELKYTQGGMAILEIRFAVGGRKKVGGQWEDTTLWLRTTMFDKRAEGLAKILQKGERIAVTGKLEVREFDRKDGTKGTSVEVFADDVVLLSGKRNDGAQSSSASSKTQDAYVDGTDLPF